MSYLQQDTIYSYKNNGIISNLYVSVEESVRNNNGNITLLGSTNNGIIENFIINYKEKYVCKISIYNKW